MSSAFYEQIKQQIEEVKTEGLYKSERVITSQQQAAVKISTGEEVLNFCANNYLGLANHPELIEAGKAGMEKHGFGMASVRFICGTQDIHKELEQKLSTFLVKKTQSYTPLVLMLTLVCSKRFWVKKTRSSLMHLTTLQSSMVSVYVKRCASVTQTTTWKSLSSS